MDDAGIRLCKKCGTEKHRRWKKSKRYKLGGFWEYTCLPCRNERTKELHPDFWQGVYKRRLELDPEFAEQERQRKKEEYQRRVKSIPAGLAVSGNHVTRRTPLKERIAMLEQQNYVCAICGRSEQLTKYGKVQPLSLDHDHRTGKVRAFLCGACNVALGWADDDPDRLRAMADYIEYWRNVHQEATNPNLVEQCPNNPHRDKR